MDLLDEDKASTFNTRAECLEWIQERVIRFKLAVNDVVLPNGVTGLSQRKTDGRILSTKAEGYKPGGLDEPLKRYAKPVRQNGKWMAVMFMDK